ncbi:MAG: transposase [Xenococcaceae cyanobacterium]
MQDLILKRHNIRFLLAQIVTVEGKTIVGKLPDQYQGHYGPTLMSFILYQHHQCRVPQNLIDEQLRELGVDISAGQVNRLLLENKESFHTEQSQILQVGLETADYIHTDDTGARHQGQNGYCTVIGNNLFAHLCSTKSKSRENYLRMGARPS